MITLLPVMQRACLCYYTIITYYYVIITPGSIITHYYLFQSPDLADDRLVRCKPRKGQTQRIHPSVLCALGFCNRAGRSGGGPAPGAGS